MFIVLLLEIQNGKLEMKECPSEIIPKKDRFFRSGLFEAW